MTNFIKKPCSKGIFDATSSSSELAIAFKQPFVPKKAHVYLDQALRSPIQQGDSELSRLCIEKAR